MSNPAAHPREISLQHLASPKDVNHVLIAGRNALRDGAPALIIDLSECEGFYPNAVAPIGSLIQYFRSQGLPVTIKNEPPVAARIGLRNPVEANSTNLRDHELLTTLWAYFDPDDASRLAHAYIDAIQRKIVCTAGVLEALEWCLYEILDNVMQHSGADAGYATLQAHRQSKRLAVSIADTGIGVHRSLASSERYRCPTAFDAITTAIKEGVTRDEVTNQGNGLFGLYRIIEQNGGTLNIRSGRGFMTLAGDRVTGDNKQQILHDDHHGTLVDFQLDTSRSVSIGSALDYQPTNLRLEALENATGEHVVSISEHSGGTGTRKAAAELRNYIENVLELGAPYIRLDFSGVAVVSSSFADEVIGKLVASYGFLNFSERVRLANMNVTVRGLLDRAIVMRTQLSGRDATE